MVERPNILLITADQLRWDCLGCYGNPVIRTPHIDGLAANGVRFENAYTPATLCAPARQSILTGQYPSAHGARKNRSAIPELVPTIASMLRGMGYQTAAFGKMHFHPTRARYGFDHMQLAEQDGVGRFEDDYHMRFLKPRGLSDQWDLWDQVAECRKSAPAEYWETYGARTSDLPEDVYHTTWIANRTIEFLRTTSRQPFFVWMSFIKPHHPFDPPRPYDELYNPNDIPLPPNREAWRSKRLLRLAGDARIGYFDVRDMSEADMRRVAAMYYGLITHIAHHIGRVVDTLEHTGLQDRTIIVFSSDHGDYLGQYGLFLKHPNVPYDALAKIPLIFSQPGVHISRSEPSPVSLVDLFPTFADYARIKPRTFHQGLSLRGVVSDQAPLDRNAVYIESEGDIKAVRTQRYKYIYSPDGPTEELYDLSDDPNEMNDLAAQHPAICQELRILLLNWLIESGWNRYSYEEESST